MLEDFGLREDPFPIVPDGPVHNWAGHQELKDDLLDLVKGVRARDIGVTEFAILFGEYGAGKSHALRFLKTRIEEESAKADGEFRSLALYLERPRVSNKLNFLEVYRYLVRLIHRDRIQEYCDRVHKAIVSRAEERAASVNMGAVKDKSSFHQEVLEGLKSSDVAMVRLLDGGADDASGVYSFLLGESVLAKKEYEGRVDSDFMAAKVLSDLFRVLTSLEISKDGPVLESIYLFVDEGEMLVEAKATESELVFSGLRELINGAPYRFCLLISFSAATALIEAIMPNHLIKRMTRPYFEVPMLSDDEAIEFLGAQINFYRPKDSKFMGTFYPFSEEAVRFIVGQQTILTPRNLFIDCKRVLERAIRRHGLQPGDAIGSELASQILIGLR